MKPLLVVVDNDGSFIQSLRRVFGYHGLEKRFALEAIVPNTLEVVAEVEGRVRELAAGRELAGALIDIVLTDAKNLDRTGCDVAAAIRGLLPKAPILAITSYTRVHKILVYVSTEPSFDGVLPKEMIVSDGFSASFFLDTLNRAGINRAARIETPLPPPIQEAGCQPVVSSGSDSMAGASFQAREEDLQTQVQVALVGEENLRGLLEEALPAHRGDYRAFEVGFSGAILFEVLAVAQRHGESPSAEHSWILKIAREKEKLERELERHRELRARGVPKEAYPALLADRLLHRGEWYCIAMEKDSESISFREALRRQPDASLLSAIFSGLGKFLAALYGESLRRSAAVWQDVYSLSEETRAKVLRFVDQSRDAIAEHCGAPGMGALEAVERVVASNAAAERAITAFRRNIDTRLIHGDLHTRNLLVGLDSGRTTTIDFALCKQDHVARDFAKLEADLFFGAMDGIAGRDTDWRRVEGWLRVLSRLAPGDDFFEVVCAETDDTVSYFSHVASRTRELARRIAPTLTVEEYLLALLHHALKAVTYDDIPLPKKALAIRFGAKIVEQFAAKRLA